MTLTTIETRTRIKAYSTIPWPDCLLGCVELTSFGPGLAGTGRELLPRISLPRAYGLTDLLISLTTAGP